MNSPTKGILFDFNGTLFYDSDLHEHAWKTICEQYNQTVFTRKEYYQYINGRTNLPILEYIFKRPISEKELETIGEEKENYYREACRKITPHLVSGAVQLLDYLTEQHVPFTIATSSDYTNVEFYFEIFPLEKWFDREKLVYNDGTFPGKPEPDIYMKAAEKIGLPPQECIVVEDAVAGIHSAHRAGVGTIIAIAPAEQLMEYQSIPEVDDAITNFHEFDRMLLR